MLVRFIEKEGAYKMERMRSFIKIVHYKINPDWFWARGEGELVLIPLLPRKIDERRRRVVLRAPGGAVEETPWLIVVNGELLNFCIHDMSLLGLQWESC